MVEEGVGDLPIVHLACSESKPDGEPSTNFWQSAMMVAMTNDIHRVVAAGYDTVADAYLEQFGISTIRERWFRRLIDGLPVSGSRVLDLGCGAGIPVARDLAALGHVVVGVDGSPQQIARARRNVPQATFVEANMCNVTFDESSFDAVGAFYSLTHVPPEQQKALITTIAMWLKPGGTLVASFGTGDAGEWTGEWLGATMYFGHLGQTETLRSLAEAGMRIRHSSVEKQDNEQATFMWIEATKDR
jgi:ubiquinone/menaquinone biosynthesis C-methylase UbiE